MDFGLEAASTASTALAAARRTREVEVEREGGGGREREIIAYQMLDQNHESKISVLMHTHYSLYDN